MQSVHWYMQCNVQAYMRLPLYHNTPAVFGARKLASAAKLKSFGVLPAPCWHVHAGLPGTGKRWLRSAHRMWRADNANTATNRQRRASSDQCQLNGAAIAAGLEVNAIVK